MITPYLSDIINNHKTYGLVRYHSGIKTWFKKLLVNGRFN